MPYVLAAIFVAIAVWLVMDGRKYYQVANAEEARLDALKKQGVSVDAPQLHPSLGAMVLIAPALTTFISMAFAFILVIAWLAVGQGTWFTMVDLAAGVGLIGAYNYWLHGRTKLRQVQLDPTARA